MPVVRMGVIGAGWFASRRHLPDITRNPEVSLAALCRRDPEALARIAAHFQPEATFTDWREMLERCPLDAVLIATPHNLHYEQARAALERGLHVLLEKPMTVRSQDARDLCRLAKERKRVLAVALNPPYWHHCHRMRGAIQSGRIGEVESLVFYWSGSAAHLFGDAPCPADLPGIVPPTLYRGDPESCGGGYLIDGGSHLVSEVLWTTGLEARAVTCLMDRTPSDRRSALAIELSNGAVATICSVGDSAYPSRRVRNTIGGSKGTITIEGFDFAVTIDAGGEPATFREAELPPIPGPVDNFVDAIQGRAELFSTAEHGAAVVEVIESAYTSATDGRTVALGNVGR